VHALKLNYNFSCKWLLQHFGHSSSFHPQNPVGEGCEHNRVSDFIAGAPILGLLF